MGVGFSFLGHKWRGCGPQPTALLRNFMAEMLWIHVDHSGIVFANSPFFITAEEAGALEARKSDEHKEVNVPAGKTHEDVKFTFLNKTLSSESEVDRSNEVEDVKFDAQLIDRMKQLSEESAECRKAVERLRQTRRDSG
ncbi:hypothetical protein FXO37_14986 [Capsicum annuum]|nr:hypothetical protein FXO37_14986 [Capsicum annuum]